MVAFSASALLVLSLRALTVLGAEKVGSHVRGAMTSAILR